VSNHAIKSVQVFLELTESLRLYIIEDSIYISISVFQCTD